TLLAQITSGTNAITHLHPDHLGTPRLLTGANASVAGFHAYFPFGEELSQTFTSTYTDRMRFTGHERDLANATGAADDLDYMHARHYGPLVGRFMSTDQGFSEETQPQSWNRYSYVLANPMTATDPTGLWPFFHYPIFTDSITVRASGIVSDVSSELSKAATIFRFLLALAGVGGHSSHRPAEHIVMLDGKPVRMSYGIIFPIGPIGDLGATEAEATSIFDRIGLRKSLTSETQVDEILTGEAESFAGAGSETELRDVDRLVSQYGGEASEWSKVSSTAYSAEDGSVFEAHAYRNVQTGLVVELKTKLIAYMGGIRP
ncbi:MAG TPA: RHS repeat-associated core domain-containing protein, partial [Thermoanaerobaculia bacterium]|nr:RHS repeat-associated core domain-containing protein [Thermoanaerobaculia bacterium]